MPSNQSFNRRNFSAILGTAVSRLSGVVRVIIINAIFGAAMMTDAFNAAFRFPNSLRDLFADGALSSAFMKILVDVEPEGPEVTKHYIGLICGFFFTVTFLLALLGAIFARPLMQLISGGDFAARGGLSVATHLFQILVFYLPLTMLNAVAMAILGVRGNNFRAMNSSIWLSIGMIFGALALRPFAEYCGLDGIYGLAWGAMLGALLQLVYQLQPLMRLQLIPRPNFNSREWWHSSHLREVLKLMAPRVYGQGAMIIALMVNTYFAIRVSEGALTYVTTAVLIIQVPIGLFGVASGFATLPMLTQYINEKKSLEFQNWLQNSVQNALWLSAFTVAGIAFLMLPAYVLIFQHGKITFIDAIANSEAICAYAMGIIFAVQAKILLSGLYAVKETRQILINSTVYLIVNVILSASLTPHFGLIGLGISFTTATAIDCLLNYWGLRRGFLRAFPGIKLNLSALRIFSTGAQGYAWGFLGLFLISTVWRRGELFSYPLTHFYAGIICVIGGLLLGTGFLGLAYWLNPAGLPLQNYLTKFTKRK